MIPPAELAVILIFEIEELVILIRAPWADPINPPA